MPKTYDLRLHRNATDYTQLVSLVEFLEGVPDINVTLTEELVKDAPPPAIPALGPLMDVRIVLGGEDGLVSRLCTGFEKTFSRQIRTVS